MVTIRRSINECLIGKTVVSKIPNRVSLMVVKLKSPQKSEAYSSFQRGHERGFGWLLPFRRGSGNDGIGEVDSTEGRI